MSINLTPGTFYVIKAPAIEPKITFTLFPRPKTRAEQLLMERQLLREATRAILIWMYETGLV